MNVPYNLEQNMSRDEKINIIIQTTCKRESKLNTQHPAFT